MVFHGMVWYLVKNKDKFAITLFLNKVSTVIFVFRVNPNSKLLNNFLNCTGL